jgi:glucose-6-phosphate 1-dehydrogenase
MNFLYDQEFNRPTPDAYETLLLDVMQGDATLFMRADEVEAQWRIVDPLLQEWEASSKEPAFYSSGSMGPDQADEMLAKQGRYWHRPRNV